MSQTKLFLNKQHLSRGRPTIYIIYNFIWSRSDLTRAVSAWCRVSRMRSLVQLLFTTPRCTDLCECTICNRFNPAKAIYDVERSIFELMCTWAAELFGSLHILELSGEWRLLKNYLAMLISRNFCVTSPVNSLSVAFACRAPFDLANK